MDSKTLDLLDLTGTKLKKLNKPTPNESQVTVLILDENELQRLDCIDSFTKVQKLSVVRNQLLRMYGVCRLHNLHTLNLAHNGILTIEGLKELVNLKYLCLAGNNIKTIEHLNTNINLEHLDLSENNVTYISDLSFIKNLKELFLHGNRIGHLRQCDRYLPASLNTLTLASNNIADLNEVSQLVHLTNLVNFSIVNNPCVNMTGGNVGFDYRPFVINWCMSVKVIDGYVVDAIESLRAEWLYSQGRGRHFRIGDHQELTQYLASVCPLSGETLETEEDRKLRLILSKAQHHQQQLRDQLTSNGVTETSPSPVQRRKIANNKNSPRLNSSRLGGNNKSPDRMATSCYGGSGGGDASTIMTQSLDPKILAQSVTMKTMQSNVKEEEPEKNGVIPGYCLNEIIDINSPLKAATKLLPVPESLMSPDYRPSNSLVHRLGTPQPSNLIQTTTRVQKKDSSLTNSPKLVRGVHSSRLRSDAKKIPSPLRTRKNQQPLPVQNVQQHNSSNSPPKGSVASDDEVEICASKLQNIKNVAQERSSKKNSEPENVNVENNDARVFRAAVFIQKMWRGYHTRNRNKKTLEILKTIQQHRTEEHIQKLSSDMESTKAALESERKIQMLQMQAINALWKKVSSIQNGTKEDIDKAVSDNSAEVVKELAQTCTVLNAQVQQLQNSMQDIMKYVSVFCQIQHKQLPDENNGIATQTEISAVHTPQGEAGKMFPFVKSQRPSSLPLPVSQRGKQTSTEAEALHEVKQFAGSLVDGVMKHVSETSSDCGGDNQDDDTITDDNIDSNFDSQTIALENETNTETISSNDGTS